MLMATLSKTSATIYALSESSRPYLTTLDPPMQVSWHRKSFSMALAQSQAVRINSRGIQFIPIGSTKIVFSSNPNSFHTIQVGEDKQWSVSKCRR